uniref:Uncharacterized protein n=1 Tax=Chenopodium quinoa TaxID=63459 RepID=A0A803LAW2_CHEQI
MMSPKPTSEDRYSVYSRQTPLRIIHFTGNFMRIWSIYSMYHYLSQSESSVVLYIFSCLVPSSIMFLVLQKPWRGRPLSNTQIVPSVINGAITALYFILWVKGVKACGPLRLPSGENLGSDAQKEKVLGMREMAVPMLAGILSAFRRVIARRISIKNQLKRRLHAITIASATCFMFPVAMWDVILGTAPDSNRDLPFSTWPYISTILFGVILISYVENIAEERLHMVFSSPKHLMVAGGCIIVLEILYKMDFSLAGFIICCALLGFVNMVFALALTRFLQAPGLGIYEATSLERPRRDHQTLEPSENLFEEDQIQMSSLPT